MSTQEENKKLNATQIGIHSVRNFLGSSKQLNLFSDPTKFSNEYGVEISGKIDRCGMNLTDIQMRVMEGILRGFTETNYKGNIPPEDKEVIAQEKYSGKLPNAYKYIREIPRLRITQKQIIEWAGLNPRSPADRQRAIDALEHLATEQFWCHYNRLAYDEAGNPEKDRSGGWKKEAVDVVDTLITMKTIREDITANQDAQKSKIPDVKYYEITPSAIFLDQRETYFVLIPYNWRDEIEALYKKKKYSSYLPKFIYFLRLQYELKRRSKSEKPYQIKWSPEEIAIGLNMTKSMYKGQKERTNKLLEEAFAVAKKLGYLQSYERTGQLDILTLQDSKFITVNAAAVPISNTPLPRSQLFDLFHKKKKELNEYHAPPEGEEKEEQLKEFDLLLTQKKPDDIEELINWGLTIKFWCDRLSTPKKLRENFDAAWSEMNASKKRPSAENSKDKKAIAEAIKRLLADHRPDMTVYIESSYAEVHVKNSSHVVVLDYSVKDYTWRVERFLQKIQFSFDALTPYLQS